MANTPVDASTRSPIAAGASTVPSQSLSSDGEPLAPVRWPSHRARLRVRISGRLHAPRPTTYRSPRSVPVPTCTGFRAAQTRTPEQTP